MYMLDKIKKFLNKDVKELDWNCLMECVEKIESLRFDEDLKYSVEIYNKGCRITRNGTTVDYVDFSWHQTSNKFQSVSNAIYEFIEKIYEAN